MAITNARIQFSSDTVTQWQKVNPKLREGEMAVAKRDSGKFLIKVGSAGGSTYNESITVWDEETAESLTAASAASASAASASQTAAAASASAASASQTAAKASETAAKLSETNAKTSETNAKASETAAKLSETNAKTSETNAAASSTSASAYASAAKTSETNAKNFSNSIMAQIQNAASSATEAGDYANAAGVSAQAAADSQTAASKSESNASTYKDQAKSYAYSAKTTVATLTYATDAEATAGTATDRMISPAALAAVLAAFKTQVISAAHPVGSIWETTTNDDPNTLWPGTTWVKMDAGRVLVAAGSYTESGTTYTYNLGDTGGEVKHQLTADEMPSHGHSLAFGTNNISFSFSIRSQSNNTANVLPGIYTIVTRKELNSGNAVEPSSTGSWYRDELYYSQNITPSATLGLTGGNGLHENRPPYQVINRWKRTA